jgi:hypothetical protein
LIDCRNQLLPERRGTLFLTEGRKESLAFCRQRQKQGLLGNLLQPTPVSSPPLRPSVKMVFQNSAMLHLGKTSSENDLG